MERSVGGETRGSLPEVTPLLRLGDRRYATGMREAELAPGLSGTFASYTYEEDRDDDEPPALYHWHVVLAGVPELIGFAPRLLCRDRRVDEVDPPSELSQVISLSYFLEEPEDTSRLPDRAVRVESDALSKRFEILVDQDVGENWVRQLMSPSFIAWLVAAPDRLSFELVDGMVCVFAPKDAIDAGELFEAAQRIVTRLRDEALEEAGMGSAGYAAQPDRPFESLDSRTARAVATVEWRELPKDEETAIRAYRGYAMRAWRPWVYGTGVFLGCLILGLILAGVDILADVSSGDALVLGLALIASAPFAGFATWNTFVGDRAKRVGRAAFALEYARARGLRPQPPRLVHARHMQLRFPGVAESAMEGALPGADVEGTLLLSAEGHRSKRREYNVAIVPLPRDRALPADGAGLHGLRAAAHDATLAIWAKVEEGDRGAESLDRFCRRAGEALAGLPKISGGL
jgi:hypothetical protein